eukprot:m.1227503 g.1227503  ORF g.1227503 m.1227503 type:complete len:73 (-) comp24643_c1_seq8:138-356(-)
MLEKNLHEKSYLQLHTVLIQSPCSEHELRFTQDDAAGPTRMQTVATTTATTAREAYLRGIIVAVCNGVLTNW